MRRFTDPLAMALGTLHILFAVVAVRSALIEIAGGGFGGPAAASVGQEAHFWSLLFGVLALTVGYQTRWAETRIGPVPAVPGWLLGGIGLVGGILAPLSPFWLVALLGVAVLLRARRGPVRPTRSTTAAASHRHHGNLLT